LGRILVIKVTYNDESKNVWHIIWRHWVSMEKEK